MISLAQVLLLLGTLTAITAIRVPALPAGMRRRQSKQNKVCPPFPYATLENGRITTIGMQKYLFACDSGYFLTTKNQVRCYKGKWTSTKQPTCNRSGGQCDDPHPISNGVILGSNRQVGATIQYLCNTGFILMGKGSRTCLDSEHWSGITPACMDETEPIQKVAERLRDKFVTHMEAYSSNNPEIRSRLLDAESLKHGLELVILIDRSSSIDPADFQVGVGFVKFLLQEFGVKNVDNASGTRAAVIAFGTKVDVLFNLDNATIKGPKTANKALDTLEPSGGGTDMKEAFVDVFTLVTPIAREHAKRALFLLTDGEPNIGDIEDTKSLAKQLKERNEYEIFTVGIGRGINRQLLSELASEPLISHIFIMDNYMDLRTVMDTIKNKAQRPKPINPARCGYIKHERNYLKHWTWLAAVYVNSPDKYNATSLQFCSGTLICDQWVITAASCFYHTYQNNGTEEFKRTTEEVFVVLGEKDLMQENRNQMNFYAEGVFIHPDFRPPNGLENNLALVKLNALAPPKRFRPVCLPPAERPILLHLELDINVSIAGWGLPPPFDNEREVTGGTVRFRSSNISIALETEDRCRMHDEQQPMSGSIFCAGGLGKQTCIGDLGSPIVAVDPFTNIHHLIGVLTRRYKCQQGINQYTELTRHLKWISDTIDNCHSIHANI